MVQGRTLTASPLLRRSCIAEDELALLIEITSAYASSPDHILTGSSRQSRPSCGDAVSFWKREFTCGAPLCSRSNAGHGLEVDAATTAAPHGVYAPPAKSKA